MNSKLYCFTILVFSFILFSPDGSAQCEIQCGSLIANGNFEEHVDFFPCGPLIYSETIQLLDCWDVYRSTPDLFGRECDGNDYDIPTISAYANPVSETWDADIVNNNHMVGFVGKSTDSDLDEEVIRTVLSEALQPGSLYLLEFYARVGDGDEYLNIDGNLSVCFSASTMEFVSNLNYDINNDLGLNDVLFAQFPSITIQNFIDGTEPWQHFVLPFQFEGSEPMQNMLLGYNADVLNTTNDGNAIDDRYLILDDIGLFRMEENDGLIEPVAPLCTTDSPLDLWSLTGNLEGTFVTSEAEILELPIFDPSTVEPGTYTFLFYAPDENGCWLIDEFEILVLENCCTNSSTTTEINNQAEADIFSNGSFFFPGDLIINCSACQITNSDFYFAPDAQCLIQEGSNVTIDNSILGSCDLNWQGIFVEGNSSTTTTEALLQLRNSTVEYAKIGIDTRDLSTIFNMLSPLNWEGGQVRVDHCIFNNNLKSISKRNSSVSFLVEDSEFYVDDQQTLHFPGSAFSEVVYLHQTRSTFFNRCNFENSTQLVSSWGNRRRAIYASKSQLGVVGAIDGGGNYAHSMKGFNYGVYATTTGTKYWLGVTVKDMRFVENRVGVYTLGIIGQDIYRNKFEIGQPTGVSSLDSYTVGYTGTRVQNGSGFEVAENICTGLGADESFMTYGIVMFNTNSNDEEVYYNFLDHLTAGNVANGDNFFSTSEGGLRYVCNKNIENSVLDIAVANGTELTLANVGIGITQFDEANEFGDDDVSAANSFTDWTTPPFSDSHFRNFGANQIEYWCNGIDCPDYYDIDDLSIEIVTQTNSCPNVVLIVGENGELNQQLLGAEQVWSGDALADYTESRYLQLSLVDGGETEELKEEVEEAWSGDTWAMREALLARSPNLSRDVLVRVADNTLTFPHPIALEILMANPQILLDNSYMQYLETKDDPLPVYMIDILWGMRDAGIVTSLVEQNMRTSRASFQQASGRILRALLSQEHPDWNLVDQYLHDLQTLNIEFLLVESLLAEGNLPAALARYAAIPDLIRLSDLDLREYELFGHWLTLQIELNNTQRDFSQLTTAELATVTNWADNDPSLFAGAMACEVLNEHYGENYFMEPYLGVPGEPRRTAQKGDPRKLNLFPNPATSLVNIELTSALSFGDSFLIQFTDASGRIMEQFKVNELQLNYTVNTEKWETGSYILFISSYGRVLESAQFDVVH